jgi:hypothetical protein
MINNEGNKAVKKEELEKRKRKQKRKKPGWLTRRVRPKGNCFLAIFLCT